MEEILSDLGLQDKPRITALNKIDLLSNNAKSWDEEEAINYLSPRAGEVSQNTVLISAAKGWGLPKLLEVIGKVVAETAQPVFPGKRA